MAALETSRSIFFDEEEGIALATGTDSASENWAFFPKGASPASVKRVCAFFKELNLPFVWAVFPGAAADVKILEEAGLRKRGELLVMYCAAFSLVSDIAVAPDFSLAPKKEKNESITFVVNEEIDVWAETAWVAFDSQPGAPDSFVNMARGLGGSGGVFLILAKRDGIPAGTVMLTLDGDNAGIYYFATLPTERRKGVGEAMLRETARIAFDRGFDVLTLQATPKGIPFYTAQGFEPLFKLPIYSFSEEVF